MAPLSHLSFSYQILIALVAGVATGLFFGELTEPLSVVGSVFVRLLQMTVLPYVLFSLVSSVGKLSPSTVRGLLKAGSGLVVGSWLLALGFVALAPLAFPPWQSASFFSDALVRENRALDLLALYLPSNPFHALANNIVPAVVVFSLAVGAALIGVPNKTRVIEVLDVATAALTRVTTSVSRFMPLAIFAVTASAAGTMSVDEISRLQVYFALYLFASIALTFAVLPAALAIWTPLRYGTVFRVCGDALVTGFTTGNLLITLPMMIEGCKEILRQEGLESEEANAAIDVLIPVTLNAPLMGKLLTLIFVPFAAWFVGTPLEPEQFLGFLSSGLVTYFGSVNAAMPFLLDTYHIPADMFELFLVTGVVSARFSTLLTSLNMIVIGLLGALILSGAIRINRRSLIALAGIAAVAVAVVLGGAKALFTKTFTANYEKAEAVRGMTLRGRLVPWQVEPLSAEDALPPARRSFGVQEIRERGRLTVGFQRDNLPYAFLNSSGTLVGLDVELAHRLATELGVSLTFVPMELGQFGDALEVGRIDVALAGLPMTTLASAELGLTHSYLDATLGLVVRDHDRQDFKTMVDLVQMDGVRIAVVKDHFLKRRVESLLPRARIEAIASPREFFEDSSRQFDALLFTAEAGAAWTLLYPEYTVVVPQPVTARMPIVMAVAPENNELRVFINEWIDLARALGVVQRAYDHWVLGQDAQPEQPRWSVLRNVLGWGEGMDRNYQQGSGVTSE